MRLFFAAWPPTESASALEGWARGIEGRVTPAGMIHLTLAFLGVVEPDKAIDAARRVRAPTHRLPIEVARYWKHNRIVWAGPREIPPELKTLVEALHLELYRAEYMLERRPYAAHVTLVRSARPPAELPPLPTIDWPVREFSLVRSGASHKGASYEVLERFKLA